ncbi:exodeoxyribonuclease III [Patescibacteria group bacterium]|nr:exodeoxyribonuclease III [Patescibacteria group bacterium]MBU1901649.1 exodeoxyribonuclease III [Patescibacteria group bacterium]
MSIISWNVNGIRAVLKKGFPQNILIEKPDIICLQESKAHKEQVDIELSNYYAYWNSAEKKGYSGTIVYCKQSPLSVQYDIEQELIDHQGRKSHNEGRVITLEFEEFFLVNVYTPNSKNDLSRLAFRQHIWDTHFLTYLKKIEKKKPVIFCGDLNVAHEEIDLARPEANHKSAGFTDEERKGFSNIMKAGFIDTFRFLHPEEKKYSWWSYRAQARERNVGWRIDYICTSKSLKDSIKQAKIHDDIFGSDHCPVSVKIAL